MAASSEFSYKSTTVLSAGKVALRSSVRHSVKMMGVKVRQMAKPTKSTANTMGITFRPRSLILARPSVGSGMVFFGVFSTSLSPQRISEGRIVKTQIMLMNTPFARTMPSSMPIL